VGGAAIAKSLADFSNKSSNTMNDEGNGNNNSGGGDGGNGGEEKKTYKQEEIDEINSHYPEPDEHITYTEREAKDAAFKYLGDNPVNMGNGRYVSQDGLRQARMSPKDIGGEHGEGPHVNVDIMKPDPDDPTTLTSGPKLHLRITKP